MTIYNVTKDCYTGLPYKFRCRVFGKYDGEFVGHAPTYINREYSDLTDYDGLSCTKEVKKIINATRYGSPTVSGYEVSGFTTSKYMTITPTFSSADSWEILLKVKSSSNSATGHFFSSMAGTSGEYAGVDISLDSGKLKLQLGINGSSFDTITAANAITANTWYWVKVSFSYSQFFASGCSFDVSTDGSTFTTIGTLTPTGLIYKSLVTRIGVYGNALSGQAGTVTIDMDACYVKLGDVKVWSGTSSVGTVLDFSNTRLPWKWDYGKILETNKYAYVSKNATAAYYGNVLNGTVTGAPKTTSSREMSEFSTSNYLQVLSQWKPAGKPWKIHLKLTTGTESSTAKYICGQPSTNRTTPQLALAGKNLVVYLASTTSSWDIASGATCSIDMAADTTYEVDFEFTGTAYTLSVDGVTGLTINNSTPDYSGTYPFIFGYDNGNAAFNGSIDLGESYIEFDSEEVWRGFSKETLQGCISGDTDSGGNYYCYAMSGDDHVEMVKKTGSVIYASATTPRYLGEVSV